MCEQGFSPQTDRTLQSTLPSNCAIENLPLPPAIEIASLKSLVRNAKEATERSAIAGALEKTHWNRKAAARLLQISYRALLYKISEYRMAPPGGYIAALTAPSTAKNTRS